MVEFIERRGQREDRRNQQRRSDAQDAQDRRDDDRIHLSPRRLRSDRRKTDSKRASLEAVNRQHDV